LPDDRDLASQPTLSRLENAVDFKACYRLAVALVTLYLRERGRDGLPDRIALDFDGTDDPAHGHQEGVAYHGYYQQQTLHPLLVFDGDTGQLITAVLRPGTVHASRGARAVLKRLVRLIRAAFPQVPIELRADFGFAVPEPSMTTAKMMTSSTPLARPPTIAWRHWPRR
jgi:Transposase DDE domain group 1